MACQGCRGFVAFILKFFNFVQAFIGVAMILYAIWMLNHWKSHVPNPPSPLAPTPSDDLSGESMMNHMFVGHLEVPLSNLRFTSGADQQLPFRKVLQNHSGLMNALDLSNQKLPAPWFIYIFLGIGIIVCLITFIGHIAAEIIHGCCLCFYSVLVIFLILLEAALVGDIFLNHHWEKDIPDDPTGEFDNIKKFIKDNVDVCKWVGLAIVIIQVFSLLLAMMLRAMVSTRNSNYDSDEDYMIPRGSNRQPLLKNQASQTPPVSATGETRPNRIDAWSKRMREKYGLNTSDFTYDSSDPKTSSSNGASTDDTQSRCAIM